MPTTHSEKDDVRIRIGTSGWHYKHWIGPFYPDSIDSGGMLEYYSRTFQTTEINNTFYQLPKKETLDQWRETVSDGFLFSVKASRYITHMKKLKDPASSIERFFTALTPLGDHLGPILFQLPPNWHCNLDRLEQFLETLPDGYRYAFEFRDTSWFNDAVYELLGEYDAAFVIYELGDLESPVTITGELIYIRLHGPEVKYEGKYDRGTLEEWAQQLRNWRDEHEVYLYFDNDQQGYAPMNAQTLANLIHE